RQNVQTAQDSFAAALTIPACQFERALRKREVDSNPHNLGQRLKGRWSIEQIFVPVCDAPMLWRCGCEAGQRKRWSQHVLPERRMRILRIERIEQQRRSR